MPNSVQPHSQQHTRLFCPWDSPCKNTGMAQSCSILCNPMEYTVHGILQARVLEWVAVPFPRGSSQSRYWTQVSHIAGEPPGKPKNTGVSNLSLLHGVFLTQESNWGFLHCRRILQQLSYDWLASISHCGLGVLMNDSCVQEAICLHCTFSSKTSIDHFIIIDGSCLKWCSGCVCRVY